MAQQTINLGTIADDGTGDTLRVGGDKINDNFTELYTADAALGTAAPLDVDPDDTLATNSDSLIPTQQAVKAYVDANAGGVASLDDVGDVNAPTPGNGEVLTWDSTPGEWVSQALPGAGAFALDDATDVDTTGAADGDVLTYDSGGGEWVPAAPGGASALVLLEQHTASSSATLNFTACISSTYDEYLIEFVNLVPATNAVSLQARMSTNGGSSYDSGANYAWCAHGANRFGSSQAGADSGASLIQLQYGTTDNTATKGMSGNARLFSPQSTSLHKTIQGAINDVVTGVMQVEQFVGMYLSTTAVDAFQFFFSSGNIASGTIRVYGVAK